MKILFISMPSIHAIRWIENLKNTDFELYWFDVTNRGTITTLDRVTQFVNWKTRKKPYIKGEYIFSKKFPNAYFRIKHLFEVSENEFLENIIQEFQPDIIHSLEMQHCSYPILKTMNKYPNIKWIYSCWGSDLYYYKNIKNHNIKIKSVLKRVDYLITDCERDANLAKELGFTGKHLGVIPGGSGYNLEQLEAYKLPSIERKLILVKGYQHTFGRALNVIKALTELKVELSSFEIVVFGAHNDVLDYIEAHNLPFKTYHRNELSQDELMQIMGKALIYIGNSISDGMSNTLLEAIVMNAFPVQSNPGNVTSEIINNTENGILIQNPDNIEEIKKAIINAINDKARIIEAAKINADIAKERLDYRNIQSKIIQLYNQLL